MLDEINFMKRFILIKIFLILSISPVSANNWVAGVENETAKIYYDEKSFRIYGESSEFIDIKFLYDLKEPRYLRNVKDPRLIVNSYTVYKQFNCKERKTNIKKQEFYAERMGIGKPFFHYNDKGWKSVPKGDESLNGAQYEFACGSY